jgi:hypothetical protein
VAVFPTAPRFRFTGALTLVGLLTVGAGRALAGEALGGQTDDGAAAAEERPAEPVPSPRPVPNFDGRREATSVGEAALWVPRVLLYPLYLVSEFVVRRPLGWLATTAEREHWPTLILDFFTFGEERQGGIIPTGMIDFGMRPSAGVYAFWNDFLTTGNDLRFRGAYGGSDFLLLRAADRLAVGGVSVSVNALYESRPDGVFHGIGGGLQAARGRFYRSTSEAGVEATLPWFRSGYGRARLSVREVELSSGAACCDEPTVRDRVLAGHYASPAGMDQVYSAVDQEAELVFDSRHPRSPLGEELASDFVAPPGSGVRLDLRGKASQLLRQSLAVGEPLADTWLSYGASLGAYYDLSGYQRTVGLTAVVDFVDPLGDGEVPLTDLIGLGGVRPLRGFLTGQLADRSAVALRADYRWPVAVWLDGTLVYEVGNVFGEHLSGFGLPQLRSSFGWGLQAVDNQDHVFQLLLAVGTEPFDDGGRIDSFRFVLGTSAGF